MCSGKLYCSSLSVSLSFLFFGLIAIIFPVYVDAVYVTKPIKSLNSDKCTEDLGLRFAGFESLSSLSRISPRVRELEHSSGTTYRNYSPLHNLTLLILGQPSS